MGTQQILVGLSGGYTKPLDAKNATAAYSIRKLRTAYTGYAMRVTKSGGATLDVGFDANGLLDVAALAAFASNNTNVTTWYDQTGNGNNATQTTFAPLIYQSSSVEYVDGFPCVNFIDGTKYLDLPGMSGGNYSVAAIGHFVAGASVVFFLGGNNNAFAVGPQGDNKLHLDQSGIAPVMSSSNTLVSGTANQMFASGGSTGSQTLVLNGTTTTQAGGKTYGAPIFIGKVSGGFPYNERLFEIVLYNEVLSGANQNDIINNQKSYYGTP